MTILVCASQAYSCKQPLQKVQLLVGVLRAATAVDLTPGGARLAVFEFGDRDAVAAGSGRGEVVPANQLVLLQEVLNCGSENARSAAVDDMDPRLSDCVIAADVLLYPRH